MSHPSPSLPSALRNDSVISESLPTGSGSVPPLLVFLYSDPSTLLGTFNHCVDACPLPSGIYLLNSPCSRLLTLRPFLTFFLYSSHASKPLHETPRSSVGRFNLKTARHPEGTVLSLHSLFPMYTPTCPLSVRLGRTILRQDFQFSLGSFHRSTWFQTKVVPRTPSL